MDCRRDARGAKRVPEAQDGGGVRRRSHSVLESPIERAEENALGVAQRATIFVGKHDSVPKDRGDDRIGLGFAERVAQSLAHLECQRVRVQTVRGLVIVGHAEPRQVTKQGVRHLRGALHRGTPERGVCFAGAPGAGTPLSGCSCLARQVLEER